MSTAIILDTETTGLTNHPTKGHPEVIEISYIPDIDFDSIQESLRKESTEAIIKMVEKNIIFQRYKPTMEIHPEAIKIHGIVYKDLIHCPEYSKEIQLHQLRDAEYLIAHNAEYDHRCMGRPDIKTICTLKIARKLTKRRVFKNGKNDLSSLIKELYPEHPELISEIHTSRIDVIKLVLLLKFYFNHFNINSWEELYKLQTLNF